MKGFDGAGLNIVDTTSGVADDAVEENLFVDLDVAAKSGNDGQSAEANGNVGKRDDTFGFSFLVEPGLELEENRSHEVVVKPLLLDLGVDQDELANRGEDLASEIFGNGAAAENGSDPVENCLASGILQEEPVVVLLDRDPEVEQRNNLGQVADALGSRLLVGAIFIAARFRLQERPDDLVQKSLLVILRPLVGLDGLEAGDQLLQNFGAPLLQLGFVDDHAPLVLQDSKNIVEDFFGAADDPVDAGDGTVGGQQEDVEDHVELARDLLLGPAGLGVAEERKLLLVEEPQKLESVSLSKLEHRPNS